MMQWEVTSIASISLTTTLLEEVTDQAGDAEEGLEVEEIEEEAASEVADSIGSKAGLHTKEEESVEAVCFSKNQGTSCID